jgi:glycosyltransferase involved in cell wall biosynthesis
MKETAAPIFLICSFKNEEIAAPIFISKLLSKLESEKYIYNLILIDDGSSDRTSEFLEQFICSKVHLLTLNRNIGKIAAQAVGAYKFNNGSSDLIFFDGDGQHDPLEILKIIRKGQNSSKITVGQRSNQYKRRIISRIGAFLLKIILKLLGIKTSLQSSELVYIPSNNASALLADSDFGFLPMNLLLLKNNFELIPIQIYPRINSTPNDDVTRHPTSELIRKALIQVYSQPLKILYKIVILGLIPTVGVFSYGIYIGISSLVRGDPTGVGSIIVIMSFSTVTLLILGFVSFGFLIVTNERFTNREAIESQLK